MTTSELEEQRNQKIFEAALAYEARIPCPASLVVAFQAGARFITEGTRLVPIDSVHADLRSQIENLSVQIVNLQDQLNRRPNG